MNGSQLFIVLKIVNMAFQTDGWTWTNLVERMSEIDFDGI